MSTYEELVKNEYTWGKFEGVRTGKPEYNKYFPKRELEDGTVLGSMFETRVAIDNGDEKPTWKRIRFYDELAEQAKSMLIDQNQVAKISCQGYLRTSHWQDEEGNDRYSDYFVIPNKLDPTEKFYQHLTVHSTWTHFGGAQASDPFGAGRAQRAADNADAADQTPPNPIESPTNQREAEVLEGMSGDPETEREVQEARQNTVPATTQSLAMDDAPF